ncbi:MAG TPA: hypothetical protein VL126_03915 [Bacteroidota bacterium]|nr:hypothetical protein [Bacteroidota bacterium]
MATRHLKETLEHWQEVLGYLKSRFPMYHQSNFFFRDLQYGIQAMLIGQGKWISYRDAEMVAREFAAAMEKRNIFIPIDRQTWVVNYPDYRTPVTKMPAQPGAPSAKDAPKAPRVQGATQPAGTPAGEQSPGH